MSKAKSRLSADAETALEAVLEGKPDAVKAKVRKLVLEHNIYPDDPLWQVMISIDTVSVLIETGPQAWQQLFAEYQEELEAWTTSNLQTLTALATEAESIQQLAQSSGQLTTAMQTLAAQGEMLNQQVQYANESLVSWMDDWQAITHQLKHQQAERQTVAATQKEQLGVLVKTVQQLHQKLDRPSFLRQTSWKGVILVVAVIYTLIFSVVSMTTLVLYLRDRPLLLEMGYQELPN